MNTTQDHATVDQQSPIPPGTRFQITSTGRDALTSALASDEEYGGCEGCSDCDGEYDADGNFSTSCVTRLYRGRYANGELSAHAVRLCHECACHVRGGYSELPNEAEPIVELIAVSEARDAA